jgi:squalene-associated FAD-dependent desaturase
MESTPHQPPAQPHHPVVIIGGGLAGLAAALALETAGVPVTLLEARAALGGRTSSFPDSQSGTTLDNCQHVLLGCCTHLRRVYERLHLTDPVTWYRNYQFVDRTGQRFTLTGEADLPAPLHLAQGFAQFDLLTWPERIAIARAMLAMLRLGHAGRTHLDELTFGAWLTAHGQPDSLVTKFYEPVLIGALNEDVRKVSAKYALQVFQDAMLAHAEGYILGVPNLPLEALYAHAPLSDLRLNTRVSHVHIAQQRITQIHTQSGTVLYPRYVILATNHHAVTRLLAGQTDTRLIGLPALESVPIMGTTLWYDRPVLDAPVLALLDGPAQWVFRKDAAGCVVHTVTSAARGWDTLGKPETIARIHAHLAQALPAVRSAQLERGVVVIEKRATFSPLPGVDRLRPSATPTDGDIENLVLAGDYTQTHWPATMEGACRSGHTAAAALLRAMGQPAPIAIPDLPRQWPARWLGL